MSDNKKKKRRRRAKRGGIGFFSAVLIILAVWYWNTYTLKTTSIDIASEKAAGEVTIVELTDLHGSSFGGGNRRLIRRINKAKPDIITVTGDMYTSGDSSGRATALSLLEALSEEYDVYYVNGEHDNSEGFFEELRAVGVNVLDYKSADMTVNGTEITLYGINNVYYTPTFDLHNEYELDESRFNILLAHIDNPQAFREFAPDLCICGDTHGGQIRLPFIGAVNCSGVWFPEISGGDTVYTKGYYDLQQTKLFVSSGLGNFPFPVRFLNRPEIAVIHIVKE